MNDTANHRDFLRNAVGRKSTWTFACVENPVSGASSGCGVKSIVTTGFLRPRFSAALVRKDMQTESAAGFTQALPLARLTDRRLRI